jgi:Carboxylesterase family
MNLSIESFKNEKKNSEFRQSNHKSETKLIFVQYNFADSFVIQHSIGTLRFEQQKALAIKIHDKIGLTPLSIRNQRGKKIKRVRGWNQDAVVVPLQCKAKVPPKWLLAFVPQRMGTVHGEELPYVFGAPLVDGFSHFPRNYTRSEVSLSEAVMLFWASFARTGWVIRSLASATLPLASNLFCFVRASGNKIMRCPRNDEQFFYCYCAHALPFWLFARGGAFFAQVKVFHALSHKNLFCWGIFSMQKHFW